MSTGNKYITGLPYDVEESEREALQSIIYRLVTITERDSTTEILDTIEDKKLLEPLYILIDKYRKEVPGHNAVMVNGVREYRLLRMLHQLFDDHTTKFLDKIQDKELLDDFYILIDKYSKEAPDRDPVMFNRVREHRLLHMLEQLFDDHDTKFLDKIQDKELLDDFYKRVNAYSSSMFEYNTEDKVELVDNYKKVRDMVDILLQTHSTGILATITDKKMLDDLYRYIENYRKEVPGHDVFMVNLVRKHRFQHIIDQLVQTYDTKFLDKIEDKELLVHLYQYVSSGGTGQRTVLSKLLYNYMTPTIHMPTPKFIGGPCTITCHFNEERNMMIYIFGETHTDENNCAIFGAQPAETMLIDEFMKLVAKNTPGYCDAFLEINATKKQTRHYTNDIWLTKQGYSLEKLFQTFKHCIQGKEQGEESLCKLLRVHYFDIRFIDLPSVSVLDHDRLMSFIDRIYNINIIVYTQCSIFYDQYKEKWIETNERFTELKEKIGIDTQEYTEFKSSVNTAYEEIKKKYNQDVSSNNTFYFHRIKQIISENKKLYDYLIESINAKSDEDIANFWYNLIFNQRATDEINKIPEQWIKDKLYEHTTEHIQVIISKNKDTWKKFIDISNGQLTVTNDEYLNECLLFFDSFVDLECSKADVYCIARMFKGFNIEDKTKTAYPGADYLDQPRRAHNIIIYAGERHSENIRNFLKKLEFDEIDSAGGWLDKTHTGATVENTCIDVRKFHMPFFTMKAIDDYKMKKQNKQSEITYRTRLKTIADELNKDKQKLDEEDKQILSLSYEEKGFEVYQRREILIIEWRRLMYKFEEIISEMEAKKKDSPSQELLEFIKELQNELAKIRTNMKRYLSVMVQVRSKDIHDPYGLPVTIPTISMD